MGLQSVNITLKALVSSAISRSNRGIVCLILDEPTVKGVKTYTGLKKVTDKFSTTNKAIITRCFSSRGANTLKVACYNSAATEAETIDTALALLNGIKFNYLACPSATTDDTKLLIANFIKAQRNANNILVKAVLNGYVADYEGIINFTPTQVVCDGATYTGADFCVDVACVIAGLSFTESLTNHTISGITSVTNSGTDLDAMVDAGQLFMFWDDDLEEYVFSRGVNSKTTIGANEKQSMKKIRVMEILDMIRDDVKLSFKTGYSGKVSNILPNRKLLVSAFNTYLNGLAREQVLSATQTSSFELDVDSARTYIEDVLKMDTTSMTDAQVLAIDTDEQVFIDGTVYIADCAEDLSLVLNF